MASELQKCSIYSNYWTNYNLAIIPEFTVIILTEFTVYNFYLWLINCVIFYFIRASVTKLLLIFAVFPLNVLAVAVW